MEKICKNCGISFHVYPANFSEREFHNLTCKTAYEKIHGRKPSTDSICKFCGKVIKNFPSRKPKIFCDQDCRHLWEETQLVEKTCIGCGTKFKVMKCRDSFKYCSHECYTSNIAEENNPHWRGGRRYNYGPNWERQAAKARERDNFTCQCCNKHQDDWYRSLDVHHIIPFRKFGRENYLQANDLKNLISLCTPCHLKIEYGKLSLPKE